MTKLANLEDLFKHLLQDMYYAEKRISEALPKMAKKASSDDLQAALETHLKETEDQISKLEEVFEMCGYKKEREVCEAIEGLLAEGEELMKDAKKGPVLDAALIIAAQKVEHYEIASYGALCSMAKKLDQEDSARLLHEILDQEKATDETLTELCNDIEEEAMEKAA